MIGFAGAHRTGKTTLAREFAARSGIPYIETRASGTFARLGLNPKADYSLRERIIVQMAILDDMSEIWSHAPKMFISDRTPVDMMAYMLADVRRENVDSETDGRISEYCDLCLKVTERYFRMLYVLQPGIPIVDEEGKAPAIASYIEHINAIIVGTAMTRFINSDMSLIYVAPRNVTDLEARIAVAMEFSVRLPSPFVNAPSGQRRFT